MFLFFRAIHIYKMNYAQMLRNHIKNNADATIAVLTVPIAEASRFGIMNTDEEGRITEFEEKPKVPRSIKRPWAFISSIGAF